MLSDSEDIHAVRLVVNLYQPQLKLYAIDTSHTRADGRELRHLLVSAHTDYQSSASSPVRRAIGLATVVTLLSSRDDLMRDLPRDFLSVIPISLLGETEEEKTRHQHRVEARSWIQLADGFRQNQLRLAQACLTSAGTEAGVDESTACRLLEYAAESLGTGTQLFMHSIICKRITNYL